MIKFIGCLENNDAVFYNESNHVIGIANSQVKIYGITSKHDAIERARKNFKGFKAFSD